MMLCFIILPLTSFLMCLLMGSLMGEEGSKLLSTTIMSMCGLLSWLNFVNSTLTETCSTLELWQWLPGTVMLFPMELNLDFLSSSMLLVVFSVSALVHLYSTSYMSGDPHIPRFMGYLSLFTFFMVVLVLGGNLPLLFMGWEGVGLCSYLLVNFWYSSMQANTSAMKAMLVNSVGDLALMLCMGIMWVNMGSLSWSALVQVPHLNQETSLIIVALLLVGAAGKSAQLGLHTWLPDAMEGPTPVSALIHAATMVTAGVYLMISCSPAYELASPYTHMVLILGASTALFAASMGLVQSDMKKVMAYSTTSQLGYMVAACGLGAYGLGLFHLMNHAFFKALLFLSAGSMMHACLDQQDLSKLGSLFSSVPISYLGVVMGSMALMGVPFMTGFYSKDLMVEESMGLDSPLWGGLLLLLAAGLTAAYSFKVVNLSFTSSPLSSSTPLKGAEESNLYICIPLITLTVGSVVVGYVAQDWVLTPNPHTLLVSLEKLSPLLITILGASLSTMTFSNSLFLIKSSYLKASSELWSFLQSAWQFNTVMNAYLSTTLWSSSYHVMYKTMDSGVMEFLLPNLPHLFMTKAASKLSSIQSGFVLNYVLYTLILFSLVAWLTY